MNTTITHCGSPATEQNHLTERFSETAIDNTDWHSTITDLSFDCE